MAKAGASFQGGSKFYPARCYYYATDAAALLEADFTHVKVERRTHRTLAWEEVTRPSTRIPLEADKYNYLFTDEQSGRDYEYRAVLMKATTPTGDVAQPVHRAVDLAHEAIMTVQELQDLYLFGNGSGMTDETGKPFPDYTFVHNIYYGIRKVETKLSIRLMPKVIVDKHDIDDTMRGQYIELFLDEHPLLEVQSVELVLPGADAVAYPAAWINTDLNSGHLRIVPTSEAGPSGAMLTRARVIPDALHVTYVAGFDLTNFGTEFADLKEVVGKEAAFGPLNVGGDLVGGAGLAGTSLSMDGLSQSVTTTNSSTNAGFGARLIQYQKELRETYKTLLPYYRGIGMRVA